ncbi:cupin domain-containing protein [Sneathiella sp. HT1-7]|uniref:cupin domain-containing protein n=1 Tax=Sneathiella sp. HT1-7 TaxID=2887192 RepID=UPI001D140889|nr:cupin domain-containing protein [Sneathiella sp. HT1-7]MCC3303340.1 cupin domain-containing protein [Sneathiella sp. HT1-7]
MKLSVSHAEDAEFSSGLRGFFEYRDLGIKESTDGKVGAHVIRAVPGEHAEGDKHTHKLEFQMVYILKGWVKFWYEGTGEVILKAGSCVHQPPGIKHQELAHSDDLELIEIILPADFETVEVEE